MCASQGQRPFDLIAGFLMWFTRQIKTFAVVRGFGEKQLLRPNTLERRETYFSRALLQLHAKYSKPLTSLE